MTYSCGKCGRLFECEDTISFCPFCGTAYAAAGASSAVSNVRIVIGSDSERTVEERYWDAAQTKIERIFRLLRKLIPDARKLEMRRLSLEVCERKWGRCSSIAQFKQQCDKLLRRIENLLRMTDDETTYKPIDIQEIADKLERIGNSMADVLDETLQERPALNYSPVDGFKRGKNEKYRSMEWTELLQTILDVRPRFYAVMDECSWFVAKSAMKSVAQEKKHETDPAKLSKQLRELAQKDYDPLFGESCEDFAWFFWESIQILINIANARNALLQWDQNECAKIEALEAYAEAWEQMLSLTLDRVYQDHKKSMIDVSEKLRLICEKTEDMVRQEMQQEE